MKTTRITLIALLTMALGVSSVSAKPYDVQTSQSMDKSSPAINIVQRNQEQISGTMISADESYYVFQNIADEAVQIIPRADVQLLETNMDVNLFSLLKGKDPKSLTDVIELNDGTRIPSIILDVGTNSIQYFTGKKMKREILPANSIYMLYIDDATISIPFPMVSPDTPVL